MSLRNVAEAKLFQDLSGFSTRKNTNVIIEIEILLFYVIIQIENHFGY